MSGGFRFGVIDDGLPVAKVGRPKKSNGNPPSSQESNESVTRGVGGIILSPVSRQSSKTSTSSKTSVKSSGSSKKSSGSSKKSSVGSVVVDAGVLPPNMVELEMTGYIAEDPITKEHLPMKDTFLMYNPEGKTKKAGKSFKVLVNEKMKTIKEKFAKIKMHRFYSTVRVPEQFAPTIVNGLSYGFSRPASFKKLMSKIPVDRRSTSPPIAPRRSKSPPTASRRAI